MGDALSTYAPALRIAQADSLTALRDAQAAQTELATATRQVSSVQALLDGAPLGADTTDAASNHRRASVAATSASDAIERARRRLDDVLYAWNEAAARARKLVEDVRNSGDLNDGWWDNWGSKIVKALVKVAEIVALVAGVLALFLGWVPILGQFLAAVALAASVVVLIGNFALALNDDADWSEVVDAAIGVAAFGVGKAAVGAFRVSSTAVRGSSRLAAGRLAAKSPAVRAAAGLPAHSNSASAIKAMLGTNNPMTRSAALNAVDAGRWQGVGPWTGQAWNTLRAVPGQTLDDVRNIRHFDWRHPGSVVQAEGRLNPMSFAGEREAAADLREIGKINSAVRHSDEVAPHLRQMYAAEGVGLGAFGYGVYETGDEVVKKFGADTSTAARLNLPAESGVGR